MMRREMGCGMGTEGRRSEKGGGSGTGDTPPVRRGRDGWIGSRREVESPGKV